ncbi:hypothetical protein D9758_002157 [Tetrapyrgos nigripes]|uniref:MFS transporter n=1 Tax=Tetrapyrgos nigripes TaxID=182062 RepID=A0A8H5LSF3_9AGAR|nr:hypothetical protein D9758_002157 [Tetrapyrgos nigripes]
MPAHASEQSGGALDGETSPLLDSDVRDIEHDLVDGKSRERLERSLLRKLDTRMSILVLIYILNYIDRQNGILVLYVHAQSLTPEVFLIQRSAEDQSPKKHVLELYWKTFDLSTKLHGRMGYNVCTGFTTNFFGALCTRFFIGFVEAAFFPGALFLISKWYKQNELSERTAYLSSGSLIANATGSLIASGILKVMDGVLGIAAWRWLFFLEGSLTVVVAIWAIFVLPDFPETQLAKFLTPAEQALAVKRIKEEQHTSTGKESYLTGLRLAVTDWKVWWLSITMTCLTLSLSFNAYFPTIMSTLGYTPAVTLLLCVPPWIVATCTAILVSRHSDKAAERCNHISLSLGGGILGFFMAMSTMNPALRYVSLFLMAQSYAGYIVFLAWISGTVAQSPSKRAVSLALVNTVSSLGNIFGSYAWPLNWGPGYSQSFAICILASSTCIIMCWVFRQHLIQLNAATARKEVENGSSQGHRYLL